MGRLKIQLNILKQCHGQSIIELTIAMAIFSLVAASLTSLLLGTFSLLQKFDDVHGALILIEDSLESIYSIKQRSWNEFKYSRSAVLESDGIWTFAGEGTVDQAGKYARTIDFSSVYRDILTNDYVAQGTPNSYLDPASLDVTVTIDWQERNFQNRQIVRLSRISFWSASRWAQTDWMGGAGQNIWSVADKFAVGLNIDFSTPGQVTLEEIATSTYATSATLESSAFKIENTSNFSIFSWSDVIDEECSECNIRFQIKTAPDNLGSPGIWSETWSGPDGDEDGDEDDFYETKSGELISETHNGDEWIIYRATLNGSTTTSPILEQVYVWY